MTTSTATRSGRSDMASIQTIEDEAVRADERRRVAALLEENAETIAAFAEDRTRLVRLVAMLVRDIA